MNRKIIDRNTGDSGIEVTIGFTFFLGNYFRQECGSISDGSSSVPTWFWEVKGKVRVWSPSSSLTGAQAELLKPSPFPSSQTEFAKDGGSSSSSAS
jgi:hypothetical protein